MLRGQKLKRGNYEVLLFPLEYMYMTQTEGGDFSHLGTLSMDFAGWTRTGRMIACPYFAPCSCTCIATTEEANRIWQSNDKVYMADGSLDYVCWVQAHDNTPLNVGTVLEQGDLLGHTGTLGHATGDHVHFNFAKGTYEGWEQVPPNNNWQLKNSIHIYNGCYVNDTELVQSFSDLYNWIIYSINPSRTKKNNFKWIFYTNKIRKRTQIDKI